MGDVRRKGPRSKRPLQGIPETSPYALTGSYSLAAPFSYSGEAYVCLAKICRSVDASGAGGAYGVLQVGRACLLSLWVCPPSPYRPRGRPRWAFGAAFALPRFYALCVSGTEMEV